MISFSEVDEVLLVPVLMPLSSILKLIKISHHLPGLEHVFKDRVLLILLKVFLLLLSMGSARQF